MTINERLAKARQAANLTQQEVANKINVQKQQIYRWEKGNQEMGIYKFKELCILYGVSADYVLGLKEDYSHDQSDDCSKNRR